LAAVELPFEQVIRALFVRFAENIGKIPVGAVAKMVIGESHNFPELARVWHDEVASKAIGAVAALVAKAQARGEVRPGDPRLYAFTLMGPMVMSALWTRTLVPAGGEPIDIPRLAAQHAEAVLRGLLVETHS
jgi:hypothetical protein